MCPRLPQKSLSPKPSTCTIHSPSSMDSTLPGGSGSHDFNNLSGNNSTNHLGNSGMDNNFSETFIPGTNPASTAMGVHHIPSGSNWQPGFGPPSFQQIQSRPADLSLGQLLVMYPAVQQLHDKWADAHSNISLALETQSALVQDNMRLTNELREVLASRRLES